MELLPTIWFIAIAVLWTGYLFLEGFDLGVGMLMKGFARNNTVQPALRNLDAFLALDGIGTGEVGRRIVRDVLHLRPGLLTLLGQRLEPAPARRRRRIEAPTLREHGVVGHVTEERREEVHLRHAREGVFGELGEVQHRDLAVLLFHLAQLSTRGASAAALARLEETANRVRARRNPLELALLTELRRLLRDQGQFFGRQGKPGGGEAGAGILQKTSPIRDPWSPLY